MGVHLVSEAERLAYADRDLYVADTDFVALPGKGLASMLDPDYLKLRASLISMDKSMGTAAAGDFGTPAATSNAPAAPPQRPIIMLAQYSDTNGAIIAVSMPSPPFSTGSSR